MKDKFYIDAGRLYLSLDEMTGVQGVEAIATALRAESAAGFERGVEAAAKICDELRDQFEGHDGDDACVSCAEAIRALARLGKEG